MARGAQRMYSRRYGPQRTQAMAHTDAVVGGTTKAVAVIDLYTALGAAAAPVGATAEQRAPRRSGFHLPACEYTQLLP